MFIFLHVHNMFGFYGFYDFLNLFRFYSYQRQAKCTIDRKWRIKWLITMATTYTA